MESGIKLKTGSSANKENSSGGGGNYFVSSRPIIALKFSTHLFSKISISATKILFLQHLNTSLKFNPIKRLLRHFVLAMTHHYGGFMRKIFFIVLFLIFSFFNIMPSVSWACACGCGVFDVGTASMFPSGQGGQFGKNMISWTRPIIGTGPLKLPMTIMLINKSAPVLSIQDFSICLTVTGVFQ